MDKQRRSLLKRQYKEDKISRGIFSFGYAAKALYWIDSSHNLPASQQRLMFDLQHGHHRNPSLRRACKDFGLDNFEFKVLETFDDDLGDFALRSLSKERRDFWLAHYQALRCN